MKLGNGLIIVVLPVIFLSFYLEYERSVVSPQSDLIEKQLWWQGKKRTYFLHVPPNSSKRTSMPLLVALHGGGGTGSGFPNFLQGRFQALADRDGFVVVFPSAIKKNWNDGRTARLKPGQKDIDDVGFIEQIVTTIASDYPIARDKLFITGMSNGGWMSARMLCEIPELFAGAALVASTLSEGYFPKCNPANNTSILVINGTEDPLLPYDGGPTASIGNQEELRIIGTQGFIDFWAKHNDCNTTPILEELPDKRRFDGTTISKYTYTACQKGTKVILYKIIGGGHTWPGQKPMLGSKMILGRESKEINACDEIWEFFQSIIE